MTDIASAELLEKGAAYIEEHGLWQGGYWNYEHPDLVSGGAAEAGQIGTPACGFGSLHIQSALTGGSVEDYIRARDALDLLAPGWPGRSFPTWNDTPGRTAGEVADAMRDCAAGLRDGRMATP